MLRRDDFEDRRKPLAKLSEGELEDLFWALAEKVVEPLVSLACYNTSPSIERSILLRMGFDSLSAGAIVDFCSKKGLLGKGAGNIVIKYAYFIDISIKEAGLRLARGDGWEEVEAALMVDLRGGSHEIG